MNKLQKIKMTKIKMIKQKLQNYNENIAQNNLDNVLKESGEENEQIKIKFTKQSQFT